MANMIKETLLQLVTDNWQVLAMVAVAIGAVGALLGSMKKLLWALFTGSLKGGEKLAGHVTAKPKPLLIGGGLLGLTIGSWWLGYSRAPERIVEVPKPYSVTDNEMIDHLRSQLDKANNAKEAIRTRAEGLDHIVTALDEQKRAAEAATAAQSSKVAELNAKIAGMSPSGDRAKMEELSKSVDDLHVSGIIDEVARLQKRRAFDYTKYLTYLHAGSSLSGETTYHRGCRVCDKNLAASKEMDAILKRNPGWTRFRWEDDKRVSELAAFQKRQADQAAASAARYSREITAFDETKTIAEWAKDDIRGKGVTADVLAGRIERGWEPRKAIEMEQELWSRYYDVSKAAKYDKQLQDERDAKKQADLARRRAIADAPATKD